LHRSLHDPHDPRAGALQVPEWLGQARTRGLLSRLSEEVVSAVVAGGHRVEYPAGAVALRWDDSPKAGVVLRGTLRAYIARPDGGQVTTRYLAAGDMTGVFAPRQPQITRAVQALEPCELLFIDAARMKELSVAMPQFAWALIEELTTVLHSTHKSLYVRSVGSVRQRVVCALLDRAEVSGGVSAGLRVPGTQQELANAVGSVREVVANVLQALRREGLVEIRRGGLVIVEPEKLMGESLGPLS